MSKVEYNKIKIELITINLFQYLAVLLLLEKNDCVPKAYNEMMIKGKYDLSMTCRERLTLHSMKSLVDLPRTENKQPMRKVKSKNLALNLQR